jgi:UDP:flavonoid glycosyltransferase YjiC (YdhE family)
VATTVIAVSRLTATRLARAIADAQARRDCARRARELGAALANEDGVARAVAWLLEKFV